MQKNYYEGETSGMKIMNHSQHNSNPDYWNILLGPLQTGDWTDKTILDFGCGCGRNVLNVLERFQVKEAHGCDISQNNINYCNSFIPDNSTKTNFYFFANDGQSLNPAASDFYDFIFSTIVLQHICVYDIRKSILTDFFRCLKSGGMTSFQMGFAPSLSHFSGYYDNATDAVGTNGRHDVSVSDPQQIIKDLTDIGFTNINCEIRNSWEDGGHSNWIFVTAIKP